MTNRFSGFVRIASLALIMAPTLTFAQGAATPVSPSPQTPLTQTTAPGPASGAYQLDPNHASVTFKINHLGFSEYTGRFDKMEGTLDLNAGAPEQSSLDITIYPNSIDTNNVKLEEELRGDKWFNVIKYPRATFHTTKIERTGATTAKVTGDFTLMGVTHNLTLNVTMIGSGMHPFYKKPVVGFSASGTFKRSDYGLSNMIGMVGDDVNLQIEAEFDKAE